MLECESECASSDGRYSFLRTHHIQFIFPSADDIYAVYTFCLGRGWLDQVTCGPLQALSLQFPVAGVKQATFPIWSIKGKGRRKGQGTCWDPSCMSSTLARRGSLTFPESLRFSYRTEKPPARKAGREGLRKDRGPSVGRAYHQASQSALPLSHIHSLAMMLYFAPTCPTLPICQLLQSTLPIMLPTCRPQRGKGRL